MAKKSVGVASSLEERKILIAMGLQFNNKNIDFGGDEDFRIPHGYLKSKLSGLTINADGSSTFENPKQGVRYQITTSIIKPDFRIGLGTKDLHVIYQGHSRYGRGACFGTDDSPGEDWENGDVPTDGLYRLGFEYIGVPVDHDIVDHGYTANLVGAGMTVSPHSCEPELKMSMKKLKKFKLTDLPATAQSHVLIDGNKPKSTDYFWGYNNGKERHAVIHAGWEKTVSAPDDLGTTDVKCKVFCHFGCSSFQHFHTIVRKRKKWEKIGDQDHFAYFTSNLAYACTASFWLHRLLSYDKYNAFKSWEPSLEYARQMTNTDLKKWCRKRKQLIYSIV